MFENDADLPAVTCSARKIPGVDCRGYYRGHCAVPKACQWSHTFCPGVVAAYAFRPGAQYAHRK